MHAHCSKSHACSLFEISCISVDERFGALFHVYGQAHQGSTWIHSFSGIQLYVMLSPCLYFISFLYLDLYVLVNDASIGQGSFIRT